MHVSNENKFPLNYSEFSFGRDVDSIYASDHYAKNQRDYALSQVAPRHEILFSFPSEKARALELLHLKKDKDTSFGPSITRMSTIGG